MATYRPSFVDTSGLSQGISRGLEIAAANKQREDQIAEARIQDFMKTYRPDKLRDNDIPDFTADYNTYKDAALMYSRLNRGGAKPEQLAIAKVQMDKALGNLNSTYTNSATASNKLAEYANYINTAKQKGYAIPNDVTNNYNALSTSTIKNIDVAKIPSAFTFDLIPKEIDYNGINTILDNSNAKLFDKTVETRKVPYGKDINGKQLYATEQTKYAGRDPYSTVDMLKKIGNSKGDIYNASKKEYEDLFAGIDKNDAISIQKVAEIKQYFPNITDVKQITPEMVFGLPFYRRKEQGTIIDKSQAEQEYRLATDISNKSLKQQEIAAKAEGKKTVVTGYHPSSIINRVMEKYSADPTKQTVKDVSRDFSGFRLTSGFETGFPSVQPIKSVFYNSGNGSSIKPFFEITVGDQTFKQSPEAFNSLLVQDAKDITFKGGEKVYEEVPTGQPTKVPVSAGKPKGKGIPTFDSKGNLIIK